jgi:hypothetical protein
MVEDVPSPSSYSEFVAIIESVSFMFSFAALMADCKLEKTMSNAVSTVISSFVSSNRAVSRFS